MPIYRVRRYLAYAGASNYYHHADVIAPNPQSAMKAVKERRVYNWRWIDRFDESDRDYERYELMYRVVPEEWSHHVAKPYTPEEKVEFDKAFEKHRYKYLRKKGLPLTPLIKPELHVVKDKHGALWAVTHGDIKHYATNKKNKSKSHRR